MAEWTGRLQDDQDLTFGRARQIGNASAPIRTTINREVALTDLTTALTTQVMTSTAIALRAGDVITNIGVQFGNTAAGTPTNWWFALYDSSATPALLAQTADQLTGAIAANSVKDLPLATAQTILTDGVYYVGIMVKATTAPSIASASGFATSAVNGAFVTGAKARCVTSGSSLTTTAPGTIASPTTVPYIPFAWVR